MNQPEIRKGIDPRKQSSFGLKNRLLRVLWGIAYTLLFRPSPRPFHSWRAFVLRIFGAQLGKGCHIYPKAVIWAPWNLFMEDEASIANGVTVYCMAEIRLGKRVVVSQGAHLCCGTHDYTDPNFQLHALPIAIKADAWVCAECFIGPGVAVGEGAVVGARSVVSKDVPEWMVCAGNPCKPLKKREMKDV